MYLCEYAESNPFSGESSFNKKILAKNFAVNKSDRDTIFSIEEQEDNAVRMQELGYKSSLDKIFKEEM